MPTPRLTADRHRLAEVGADPVTFCRGLLRWDPWAAQAAVLRSVATNRRTAVKAAHASGKTAAAARAVLWWVTRYPDGIAITTAPSWEQVERLLWGSIHQAVAGSRLAYPPLLQTELRFGPDNYAIGLSTNRGVRFQGFHGRVLIVIDEAPGVEPAIWEAIEGIRAGGDVHVLALGNPTIASGPFHDAFTSQRGSWETFTISALDTPNFAGYTLAEIVDRDEADPALDDNVRPYLTTRRWVWEKYRDWGPGHPLWEARVLGAFPAQAEDALLSLAWLEAAGRRVEAEDEGEVTAGVDVAGPGEDETVLVVRCGERIVHWQAWARQDARGEVAAALLPWKQRLVTVNVDSAGIGYYLARHLADLDYAVAEINVGERADDPEKYVNKKAELYWGLRLRFAEGAVSGLTDDRAIAQLAGIRYSHNARGQVVIESKEEARRRGVKSPDRAEAIMLAFIQTHHWFWA
jgi:phage terminase large subunit